MIAIIDYDAGNLQSVINTVEFLGGEANVTRDPDVIHSASKIILPGVGSFKSGMMKLSQFGLDEILKKEILENKKPFLGICLGMQLLAEWSDEDGGHEGLGIIKGKVTKIKADEHHRVPHVGWNEIKVRKKTPLLSGIPDKSDFYFVHSFCLRETNPECIACTTDYNGDFVSGIQFENVFAFQFHPEKSQDYGTQIIQNFLDL